LMVAVQYGMTMTAVIEPLSKTFTPWLFGKLKEASGDDKALVVKRTYQYFIVLSAVALALAFLTNSFFDYLVDPEYHGATALVPLILIGYVMQGCYAAMVNYLLFVEKTKLLSAITVGVTAVGTCASYFAILEFGIMGAAAAFAFNNMLLFLLVWAAAAHWHPMPWAHPSFRANANTSP